jgi:hypothetical protein
VAAVTPLCRDDAAAVRHGARTLAAVGHDARAPDAVGYSARVPAVVPHGGRNLAPPGRLADRWRHPYRRASRRQTVGFGGRCIFLEILGSSIYFSKIKEVKIHIKNPPFTGLTLPFSEPSMRF